MLRGCPRDARLHDGVAPCVAPCLEIIPRRPRRRRPAARRHPARSLAPRASTDAASAATAISWPEGAGAAEIGATKATASVANLGARGEIATGLPFLDHMIDQLTSHAQLGVSVVVSRDGVASVPCIDASGTDEQDEGCRARREAPRSARRSRRRLAPGVGRRRRRAAGRAEFAAPLDEAYSTCVLDVARGGAPGSLRFELAPYGPGGSSGARASARTRRLSWVTFLVVCARVCRCSAIWT